MQLARQSRGRRAPRRQWLAGTVALAPERRSVVLEVVTRILFHTIVVFSIYLLFSGHNEPGGGFAGGLVAGLALVLRYLAGGRYELGEAAPVDPGLLLGAGLLLSGGTGVVGLALGAEVLPTSILYDANGFEVWRYVGDLDWTSAEATKLLSEGGAPARVR